MQPILSQDPADEYHVVQEPAERTQLCRKRGGAKIDRRQDRRGRGGAWLEKFALMDRRYRSYVINYNLGEDIIRGYIEKRSGATSRKGEANLPNSCLAAIAAAITKGAALMFSREIVAAD